MRTIFVTTSADVVNRGDGVTSLREALGKAARSDKPVKIAFQADAFTQGFASPEQIQLEKPLVVAKGSNVVIDGSLPLPTSDYNVSIGQPVGDRVLTVAAGAKLTLRDIKLTGGTTPHPVIGDDGRPGNDGTPGPAGEDHRTNDGFFAPGTGESGGDGGTGTDGTVGGSGALSVGGIWNKGTLTLEHVYLQSLGAKGGDGSYGGRGGRGGKGGDGADAVTVESPLGRGGLGAHGSDGGQGGDGGHAAGAIYNTGKLTLRDVAFVNNSAEGGRGGNGGGGGNGGHGGDYGRYGVEVSGNNGFGTNDIVGGDGGDGGNGGRGGRGGNAAASIWNAGSIVFDGVQSTPDYHAIAGTGGQGGSQGFHGSGGTCYNFFPGDYRWDGADGVDGAHGANGKAGIAKSFIGASPTLGTTFVLSSVGTKTSETGTLSERALYLGVEKFGAGAASVSWRVVAGDGVTASDFYGGVMPGGKLDFSGGTIARFISIIPAVDLKAEGVETLTVELYRPRGGSLGWSHSIDVKITDGAFDPITGTKGNDTNLGGTAGNDVIFALGGNDTVSAKKGDDIVNGGAGNDKISGGDGNDEIDGSGGRDRIDGGLGNDRLLGGADADRFVFTGAGDATWDTISDFEAGTDKILLTQADFDGIGPEGALDVDAFFAGSAAETDAHRIIYTSNGELLFDADGNGTDAAVRIAFLVGAPAISADDILII